MRGDIVPPERAGAARPARRTEASRLDSPQPSPQPATAVTGLNSDVPASAPATPQDELPPISQIDEAPRRRLPSKRLIAIIAAAIVSLVVVALTGLIVWYTQQLAAVSPESDEKIMVTIQPGTGLSDIAATLKRNDLIRSELAFEWYVRQSGKTGSLQSGSYRLAKAEGVPAIVKHLTSGNTDTFSITFLPGATLAKHRQVLIDAGYDTEQVDTALAATYDHPIFDGKPAEADLEGYIYGETYNFPANATVEQILTRTFDQFETVVTTNDLKNKYKQQGFSLFQGITMASIIQREVATPEDAAQVAQVFKLRYDQGMQLGSDVTYQYIADKTGQARSVDLDSPYNTRRYTGLPPGPISSPGIAALTAVANPAPGDYVYFLSGDDDKTYFARTNEEHERNVREHCQKKCQII